MALLGFLGKKKAVKELEPPAPGPDQAAETPQGVADAPKPEATTPKEESPFDTPTSPDDKKQEQTLPPLTMGQEIEDYDPEKDKVQEPPSSLSNHPDMPPAFDVDTEEHEQEANSVSAPTSTVGEEPHLEDLPKFDEMPEFAKTQDEHNLPSFDADLPKMGEGITPEQKAKLEEVLEKAPTTTMRQVDNTMNSDLVKHDMNPEEIAKEMHDIPEHIKEAEKLISYDHDIQHTADVGAENVDVPKPSIEPKFDNMQKEVEQELDKQVSGFSLDELELKRNKESEPIEKHEKTAPASEPAHEPKTVSEPIVRAKPVVAKTEERVEITPTQKQEEEKGIIPLDSVKKKDLLSKKKYYLQTKPIFIFIDKYRYMLDRLHESKACIKTMEGISQNLFEINKNQEVMNQNMLAEFEKIQESLIYIDHTIFERE